ncbi:MAG TPA: response regulator [Bacteroidia bacterium]|nr:response regulator [Bacteroidia bacterium]
MSDQSHYKVFVVDDDQMQSEMIVDQIKKQSSFEVISFSNGKDCLKNLHLNPNIVVLDYQLDTQDQTALDGLDVLQEIKKTLPDSEVIMFSGQEKIEVAVNTMKYGAFDYIVKGESAFHRLENTMINILRKFKLTKQAKVYRKLSLSLGIVLIVMIFVIMILFQQGAITANPGWM